MDDDDLTEFALYEDREEPDAREEPRRCLRGWEEREELTFVIEAGRRRYNMLNPFGLSYQERCERKL